MQSSEVALPLARWTQANGRGWRVEVDDETGFASMLYGGRSLDRVPPRDELHAVAIAHDFLGQTWGMFGIGASMVANGTATLLPLSQIGSSDKWAVRFDQTVAGVPVVGGWVNVLMSVEGGLLAIQTTALPVRDDFSVAPALSAERATHIALADFAERFGPVAEATPAKLIVARTILAGREHPKLAWEVLVSGVPEGVQIQTATYSVDAQDGWLLQFTPGTSRKRSFPPSAASSTLLAAIPPLMGPKYQILGLPGEGKVKTMATPGVAPDTASNPETAQLMPYVYIYNILGQHIATANASGKFTVNNVPGGAMLIKIGYQGTFNNVVNNSGADYYLTAGIVDGDNGVITLNPGTSETVTAQANAFVCVEKLRSWVKANGSNVADFVVKSIVNATFTNCNANHDDPWLAEERLKFYAAGGGCPNTAYSTVISHEHGHWLNDKFGTGNGPDGIGEGNADVWAMYLWDTPIIAQDLEGTGNHLRTGLNQVPFCGDSNPSCHGGKHDDGQPWMGAAWKIRDRLNTKHGNAQGDMIADELFLSWMTAFDQTELKSVIETQWLTLDDDNNDMSDGTPNLCEIDGGFRDQQFPGFSLPPVLHYSFDDSNDLGHDDSGNGHQGVVGAATVATGKCPSGSSLSFQPDNGQHDLTTPDHDDLDIVLAMTGMAWIRPTGQHDNDTGCVEGTIFAKGGNYWFQVGPDNNQLEFQNDGGPSIAIVPAVIPVNQWTHVAFVRSDDNKNVRFFVNGEFIGEDTLTSFSWFNPDPLMIGNHGFLNDPTACEFYGQIDEIKLFDFAMPDCRIAIEASCP